ncbi:MAG: hypothetical protein IT493_11635 [Gammaproteobacteria bacterium]|nr:hypothetical protein [Gammaproteobacteria bacterium]
MEIDCLGALPITKVAIAIAVLTAVVTIRNFIERQATIGLIWIRKAD